MNDDLVQRLVLFHQRDNTGYRRPVGRTKRLERFAEACALQQRKRNLRYFSEPLRDVNQLPLWVGLPKSVAGVFLKFLEQQRDSLGLTFELQLRAQIVVKQVAV